MESTKFSDLRPGCSVFEITEDESWTYCRYRDSKGEIRQIKSHFLVGADGKTGYTRKNYLEPLGITMEQAHEYVMLPEMKPDGFHAITPEADRALIPH